MSAGRWLRRGLVLLGRSALVLVGLLALVALALLLLLGTAPGRKFVLARALEAASAALPGALRVEQLERASPYGVALSGVALRDPTGLEVLRLERIEVELDPWPLARGRIVVPRVLVADGFVDLSDLQRSDRGLLAALIDPDAPPAPPSDAPPPYVLVSAIELRDIDLRAPEVPPLGALNVQGLALGASFELDGKPRAVLQSLSAGLEREGAALGRIERVTGLLGRGAEPSELALLVTLVGAELELSVRGVLPGDEGWRAAPCEARFALRGVSARGLSELLRDAALQSAFAGDAGLDITASGAPDDLAVRATITSAAGPLALDARIHDLSRAEARLHAGSLALRRVRAELPPEPIGFTLRATADAADRDRIPFSLEVPQASFGAEALPALALTARFERDAFREIALRIAQGESKLEVRGEASLEGALGLDVKARLAQRELARIGRLLPQEPKLRGQLSADVHLERGLDERVRLAGKLSAASLAADEMALEQLQARFDIAAPLFGGDLDVELRGLRFGEQHLSRAKLALHGGGRHYRLSAEAAHTEAQAALALDLELSGDEVGLRGNARGELRGEPFELAIAPTRLRGGSAVTRGLTLRVAGQELRVRGSVTHAAAELELETDELDLGALGAVAALPEKLSGSARLQASVSGSLAAPRVALALEGSRVSLGERPPLDARLSGTLDAAAGSAELDLRANGAQATPPGALSLELVAQHHFSGGRRWLATLEQGEAQLRLELPALDLAFVEAWLGAPLGVKGNARLSAEARGSLAQPELSVRSQLQLTPAGQTRSLRLEPQLRFAQGRLQLDLPADDAQGRWLDANAELDFGAARSLPELARDLRSALAAARVTFEARLAERELASLPIAAAELPSAAFSAQLRGGTEPGREPHAELQASLRQTGEYEGIPGCKASGTATELALTLRDGALKASLTAASGERRLFEARADAELGLAALLRGAGARIGQVGAKLVAQKLELASLPLLCGRVAGSVDSDIALDDVLGERPSLRGRIQARGLSLGTTAGLDLSATLRADHEGLALDAELGTRAGASALKARMPIAWSGGKLRVERDAPFELHARLNRLPIAPLLDPRGAISYASGSVSGDVHADGKLNAPRARGELRLENVAFTATSLAQPLRDIEGRLAFTESSLAIESLRARDKDGELRLDGSVSFPAPDSVGAQLRVVARRFPLRQEGQVVATSDVDARIDASVTPERTLARVTLENVDTWIETASGISGLALDAHPEFVIDGAEPPRPREAKPAAAAAARDQRGAAVAAKTSGAPPAADPAPADTRVTELSLDASDRFWVKRDDFAVKLATKLDARIDGADVRVTGKVDIDRGYLSLLGKIFTLERGSHLEFVGSEAPDPVVSITAAHENRRAGSVIKVQITGRGSKPELTFFIDERATSAGDAFLAIYGNQQSNQRPGEASDQARQFVGGLAAGLLATSARRELGAAAPIIMVEPGEQTGQGRVRAGLELDSLVPDFLRGLITGVYFEGIVARESENPEQQQANVQGGALLELYFPKGFFSTGQYGPGATWSLDWGWQL